MANIKNHHGTELIPLQDAPEPYRTGYHDGYDKGYKKGFDDGAKGRKKKFVMTALDDNNSNLINPKSPLTKKED